MVYVTRLYTVNSVGLSTPFTCGWNFWTNAHLCGSFRDLS